MRSDKVMLWLLVSGVIQRWWGAGGSWGGHLGSEAVWCKKVELLGPLNSVEFQLSHQLVGWPQASLLTILNLVFFIS